MDGFDCMGLRWTTCAVPTNAAGKRRKAAYDLQVFRTMSNHKDANGRLLPDEKRITAFGKFLRSTSLDELPELVNVIKGEMSIVGPKPLLMQYLERYTPEQMHRHEVKPGITPVK